MSMGTKSRNGPPFYTKKLLVSNRQIKFIVYTGLPVTLKLKVKFNNITVIKPVTEIYREVNDNEKSYDGKTIANIEVDCNKATGVIDNNQTITSITRT